MIVFKRKGAVTEFGPQLLRRHIGLHVLIELELLLRNRVQEWFDDLEESHHHPWHVDDQRLAQSLRVMCLKDVEHFLGLADGRAGVAARPARLEVDEERQRLLTGGHQLDAPLQHEDQVLDLTMAGLGVLSTWIQVLASPPFLVEAQDDLLACLVLRGDVLWGEFVVHAKLASPEQSGNQPLLGLSLVPFGGAQVAQETFAGQPEFLVLGEILWRIFRNVDAVVGLMPAFDLVEEPVILVLLFLCEFGA